MWHTGTLATFWNNWATFYFSIWSHCQRAPNTSISLSLTHSWRTHTHTFSLDAIPIYKHTHSPCQPVWHEVRLKSSPISLQLPLIWTRSLKRDVFQNRLKVSKYLGYLGESICYHELWKKPNLVTLIPAHYLPLSCILHNRFYTN